jgi:antitoxin PrlF
VIKSRISPKGQITLPRAVRAAIGAGPGDTILYEVEGDVVRLRRVDPFDVEFHEGLENTLDEWTSDEDEKAFGDL